MAKTLPCRYKCGQMIWFDWDRDYDDLGWTEGSDKANIPLQVDTNGEFIGKKHNCPNNPYNKNKGKSGITTQVTKTVGPSVDSGIMAAVQHIGDRMDEIVESQSKLTEVYGDLVELIGSQRTKEINDPNNDDGDSSRENGDFPER